MYYWLVIHYFQAASIMPNEGLLVAVSGVASVWHIVAAKGDPVDIGRLSKCCFCPVCVPPITSAC